DQQAGERTNARHLEKRIIEIKNDNIFQPAHLSESPKQAPLQRFRFIFVFSILFALVVAGLALYRWRNGNVAKNQQGSRIRFQNAQMTRLTSGKALKAAVSPDGKQVAYVLEEKEGQSLWLRRTAVESGVLVVPPHSVDYLGVNFSRDGDIIYYITSEPRKFEGTLYSVPVLGGQPRRLLEKFTGPIGLSHDGRQIAFTICRSEAEGNILLMVASADGSHEHQVYVEHQPIGLSTGAPPAWSPDDSQIATLRTDTREVLSRFIAVNPRDGSVTDLSPNEWKLVDGLEWETDGLFVSAQHQTDDNFQLWQIDPAKQTAQKMTNDLNRYDGISFANDRQRLAPIQNVTLTQLWSGYIRDP